MDYKLKKIKSDIEFEQSIDKLINDTIFLAAQIGVKEIKKGIDTSTDIKGRAFKRLAPSTIKQKKKKGQPTKPLIATGMMRRLPPVKGKSGKSTISVANKRTDVSQYHDQGGSTAGQPPKREWFGLTKAAEKKIDKMFKSKLVKLYSRL